MNVVHKLSFAYTLDVVHKLSFAYTLNVVHKVKAIINRHGLYIIR